MGTTGWDDFCAALDGKFSHDPDMEVVSYDESSDMVTIAGDLMVPVPVYNYARYIKQVGSMRWGCSRTTSHACCRTMSLFARKA